MQLVSFNRNENVGTASCSWDEFASWRDAVCAPTDPVEANAALTYLWELPCPQTDDRYGLDAGWADGAPDIGAQGVGLWGASEWSILAFTLPAGGLPIDGEGLQFRADGTFGLNFATYGVMADGPYTDLFWRVSQAAFNELQEILGLLTLRAHLREVLARYPILETKEAA